jgi:hypothetical protein
MEILENNTMGTSINKTTAAAGNVTPPNVKLTSLESWCETIGLDLLTARKLASRQGVSIYNTGGVSLVSTQDMERALAEDATIQKGRSAKRKVKDLLRRKKNRIYAALGKRFLASCPPYAHLGRSEIGYGALRSLASLALETKAQLKQEHAILTNLGTIFEGFEEELGDNLRLDTELEEACEALPDQSQAAALPALEEGGA